MMTYRNFPRRFMFLFLAVFGSACAWGSTALPAGSAAAPTPTPTPGSGGSGSSDACLAGTWTMPTSDVDALIAALLGLPTMHVMSGGLSLSFVGGSYDYRSDGFVLRVDLGPDQYMEATATFHNSGTYSVAGGSIVFDSEESVSEVSTWTGYKGGETVAVPGAGPEVALSVDGEAPYRCAAGRLEIDTRGAGGRTATMVFSR